MLKGQKDRNSSNKELIKYSPCYANERARQTKRVLERKTVRETAGNQNCLKPEKVFGETLNLVLQESKKFKMQLQNEDILDQAKMQCDLCIIPFSCAYTLIEIC